MTEADCGCNIKISVPAEQSTTFCERLLEQPNVALAGLAARDSLRIEAGMCLYGHDLDESTTPVQGALSWLVSKDKREPAGQFIGSETVLEQLRKAGPGPGKRRVGLVVEKGAPAREGAKIFDASGEKEIGMCSNSAQPRNKKKKKESLMMSDRCGDERHSKPIAGRECCDGLRG